MRCIIWLRLGLELALGFGSGLGSSLSQKFANCACMISNFVLCILQIVQIDKLHATDICTKGYLNS